MKKLLSASVMCADLMNMKKSIQDLEKADIDYLHIDLMDGSFVPNITLGFDFVNAVKKLTDIPFDIHMMVNDPARFLDLMNLGKDDYLCIHYEGDIHAQRTLAKIREKGCKSGLALNPQTPVNCYEHLLDYMDMALVMTVSPGFAGQKIFAGAEDKVRKTRKFLDDAGFKSIPIEVDGNISPENGAKLSRCGAEIFVLGTSSLFIKGKDMTESANAFRAGL
ncbi:MAG: ribulose-phosphate 3-epimerase [Clostridia bacterium]|nr:ribulose-phosphate 3-epimerase [Clostridia bacterium]